MRLFRDSINGVLNDISICCKSESEPQSYQMEREGLLLMGVHSVTGIPFRVNVSDGKDFVANSSLAEVTFELDLLSGTSNRYRLTKAYLLPISN